MPREVTADVLWDVLLELADEEHAAPINQFPGLWELELPDGWKLTANGHDAPLPYTGRAGFHHLVDGQSVWLEHDDWPAGILDRRGAEISAPGIDDAPRSLRRAIRDRTARLRYERRIAAEAAQARRQ